MKNKNKSLNKQLETLSPGDLVKVEWTDASIGKSMGTGIAIDVAVCSWGVYIGVLGEKTKHIVLAQNNFRYADGLYDIDFTAIPLSWTANITVIIKNYVSKDEANQIISSFLMGGRRTLPKRRRQQRVVNHDRVD